MDENGIDLVGSRSLDDVLLAAANAHPEATMLTWVDAESITYAEFLRVRGRAIDALQANSVAYGDAVTLHLNKSTELLGLMFGLYHLGAVAAMSNTANTPNELGHIVTRTKSQLVIASRADWPDGTSELDATVVFIEDLALSPGTEDRDGTELHLTRRAEVRSDTPATMIFTSGTTAAPKAVVYSHGNQVFGAESYAQRLGLRRGDRLMHHFPLFHMNGLNQLSACVLSGTLLLMVSRFRSGEFDRLVDKYQPTATYLNGTHIKMIRETGTTLEQPSPLARVGMALQMAPSDYRWFKEKYGDVLSEGYGLTESVSSCLGNPFVGAKEGSCGFPVSGYKARLVGSDGSVVQAGDVGEIQLWSYSKYGLMTGYFGDPEATAAAFDGDWLRTGDLARQDDEGYIYFVEREKDVIKRAGENISAREVEVAIEDFAGVRHAAVVGRPDRLREEVPVAFVVGEYDDAGLREHLKGRLSSFKTPEEFVHVDQLPTNHIGKIEKNVLRARLRDAVAQSESQEGTA